MVPRARDGLQRDKRRSRALEDASGSSPVGVAAFDRHFGLQRFDAVWEEGVRSRVTGSTPALQAGADLYELLPGGRELLAPVLELVLAGESVCLERVASGSGDAVSYWDLAFTPLLQGNEVTGILGITRDVTAIVRASEQRVEDLVREAEQQRQLADGLRDILAVLNSDRPLEEVLDYIVAQASRLLGADATVLHQIEYSRKFVAIAASFGLPEEVRHVEGFPLYAGEEDRMILNRRPVIVREITGPELVPLADAVDHTVRLWRDVTSQRYRSWMAVPLVVNDEVYGSLAFYYAQQRDFADDEVGLASAFADQAALAIENARLYSQAEQLAVVRERERLARELHDSITQTLYSLTLLAEAGQRLLVTGRMERVRAYLEEMSGLAQQTLREMRLLVYELRPLVLKREGLVGALQHRLDSVEKRAGVEARLLVEGALELPVGIEEGLYRVAQEALNNALKHAKPRHVSVLIRSDETRVEMEIVDDGRGFELEEAGKGGGMGLIGMQERIDKLDGELEVSSKPGQGTRVRVTVEVS